MNKDRKSTDIQNSFDFNNYILKLIAHWYLFLITITIGFGYKIINNRFLVYTYSTNATLILYDDLQNTQAVVGSMQLFDNRKNYETEFGILKSYSLNKIAVSELDFTISYFKDEDFKSDIDLYKKTPFIVNLDLSKYQANGIKYYLEFSSENKFIIKLNEDDEGKEYSFGQTYKSDYQCFTIEKNTALNIDYKNLIGMKYYFYKNDFNSLVLEYKNRLNVDLRSPNSSILWLWMDGTVGERIVDYVNKIAEVYMRRSLEAKNRIVLNTIKFVDTQLDIVVDSLDKVEDKLQFYKQSNNILDIGKEAEMLFTELDRLQEAQKLSEIKRNFYQYLLKDIEKNGNITNTVSPYLLDIQDAMLEGLLSEYQSLNSELEVLKYDIKQNIPQLDILNLKMQQLQKRLKQHIITSQKAIDYNLQTSKAKIKQIDKKLRQIPGVEREISYIQRKYKLNDNIYTFLLQKRTEAGMTMASNSPGAQILDLAMYQNVTRNAPQGSSNMKIILISLLIPILIIIIKEFFNNKIIDRSDVEKWTNLPILSSISNNSTKTDLPVHVYPKNPVSESFRLLKTNLQYLLIDKTSPVVSVNSTVGGEGKTFCSSNLASLFAMSGKKVLLIGLDLRKPRVHIPFNNSNTVGLSTYLIGANEIEEVIFDTEIDNLNLLPAGPIPPNPAELIESDKMSNLIIDLKKQFDYIIIDTAPVVHVTDALLIAKFTDANIFVIRQNYSNKNVMKVIDELNQNNKMKNMGLVINDVNPSMIFGLKYGYGFSYGYNYGYGQEAAAGYYDKTKTKRSIIQNAGKQFYNLLKKLFD